MINPSYRTAKETLLASDGGTFVLYDMLHAPEGTSIEEFNGNVYRLSPHGEFVWQIAAPAGRYAKCPFTNILFGPDKTLQAFRWDGFIHRIDIETGKTEIIDCWK